ncbi:MAG: hypothetical protein ACREOO_10290 [bacterium]
MFVIERREVQLPKLVGRTLTGLARPYTRKAGLARNLLRGRKKLRAAGHQHTLEMTTGVHKLQQPLLVIANGFGIFVKGIEKNHGVLLVRNFCNVIVCIRNAERHHGEALALAFGQALIAGVIIEHKGRFAHAGVRQQQQVAVGIMLRQMLVYCFKKPLLGGDHLAYFSFLRRIYAGAIGRDVVTRGAFDGFRTIEL